jgi:Ca2+-transporting ATPase
LATDPPTEDVLDRPPDSKRAPLITMQMAKMILGQAVFQITLGLLANYYCASIFGFTGDADEQTLTRSFVFNMFVFLQLFNEGIIC